MKSTSKPKPKAVVPKKLPAFPSKLQKCTNCDIEITSKEVLCINCKEEYDFEDSEKNIKKKSISVSHSSNSYVDSKQNYYELSKARIPLKNLVYVIGLAPEISKEEILNSYEYFGQYGKINKLVVNKNKAYNPNSQQGPSYSAYITFSHEKEASLAIYAIDEIPYCNRILRASYGTTKYCTYFLKNQDCPNAECFYLHQYIKSEMSYDKDEISNNKNIFADQQKLALSYLKRHYSEILKLKPKNVETKLPNTVEIISKLKIIKSEEGLNGEVEEIKVAELEEPIRSQTQSNKKPSTSTTSLVSSRTNKNKTVPQRENAKALDIITIDDSNKEKNSSLLEKEDDKKDKEKEKKINKHKKKTYEEEEKEESNSLPANPHDYYNFDNRENEDDKDLFNLVDMKLPRKTESMHIDFCDIDRKIIASFLSDEFGKNANSRFSFANNNNHKKEETEGEEYKRKMSKSIQEFLKMSISPSFSPDKKIKTDILFENFISSGNYSLENETFKLEDGKPNINNEINKDSNKNKSK